MCKYDKILLPVRNLSQENYIKKICVQYKTKICLIIKNTFLLST